MGIICQHLPTMIKTAFYLLFLLECARACIIIIVIPVQQKPTTGLLTSTTTSSTTTTITTTTTATTTTLPSGRKKRSVDECETLVNLEELAFNACPHGADGFTWQEVEDCESKIAHIEPLPFVMPDQKAFEEIEGSGNGDGVLTMEEWRQFVGCQ